MNLCAIQIFSCPEISEEGIGSLRSRVIECYEPPHWVPKTEPGSFASMGKSKGIEATPVVSSFTAWLPHSWYLWLPCLMRVYFFSSSS